VGRVTGLIARAHVRLAAATALIGGDDDRHDVGWTTSRTLAANRETARDQRIWDSQARVYEELLAYVMHRQEIRDNRFRLFTYSPEFEAKIQAIIDSHEQASWFSLQARARAFTPDEVSAAFDASREADRRVWQAHNLVAATTHSEQANPQAAYPGQEPAPDNDTRQLLREAQDAEDALVRAVRHALQGHRLPRQRRWRLQPPRRPVPRRTPAETGKTGTED
jgi:hypothetical protein